MDSWVRYEQQLKESEQAELTKAVIDKVLGSIKDEKTQREILLSSVAEVERELSFRDLGCNCNVNVISRTGQGQGDLDTRHVCMVLIE